MMGQSVLLDLEDGNGTNNDDNDFDHEHDVHDNHDEYWLPGDEVYVYAYTGTWTADWPHNHFTQFLGDHHRFYHHHHHRNHVFLQEFYCDRTIIGGTDHPAEERTKSDPHTNTNSPFYEINIQHKEVVWMENNFPRRKNTKPGWPIKLIYASDTNAQTHQTWILFLKNKNFHFRSHIVWSLP